MNAPELTTVELCTIKNREYINRWKINAQWFISADFSDFSSCVHLKQFIEFREFDQSVVWLYEVILAMKLIIMRS